MDEEADLALLDQHLIKTNQLSQRMTSILSQLDSRLSRLDKTVAPLGIQPHYRHAQNLDQVLSRLQAGTPALAPSRSPALPGTPADETAIIMRGPDPARPFEYTAAIDAIRSDLERMDRAGSHAREAGIRDLSSLLDQGVRNLLRQIHETLRESIITPVAAEELQQNGPLTPNRAMPFASALGPSIACVASLRSSPSAAIQRLIQPRWIELRDDYSQIRGQWSRRCLERSAEAIDDMDTGVGLGATVENDMRSAKIKAVMQLGDALIALVETETLVLQSVWPHDDQSMLPQTFREVADLVDSTLRNISSTIKKAVSSHIFLAMELYEALAGLQTRWDDCLVRCLQKTGSSSEANQLQNLFANHLNSLRAIALRSFPELLVDIKTAAMPASSYSNVAEITHSTIHYLERIPLHEVLIRNLLLSLGERNWLMGASEPPSSAKLSSEGGILNLFVADVIGTLLTYLSQRGQSMKRVVGAVFLLNNISHIRETTSSFSSDIIGPGAEDMLNRAFREAKSSYLHEWKALMTALTPTSVSTPRFGVGGHSERQQTKDAITAFSERLDEIERVSRQYPLSRHDAELRDRLCADVLGVVSSSYTTFHQKCAGRNLEKYLKQSPAEINGRISALFR